MTSALLIVGTDGSCLRNPNGPTGWAYICDDDRYGSGGRAAGTNQIGELMAILTVLRDFADERLQIQSDSAYAIGCSSTWKPAWQGAGYLRKTGPIANLDIIKEIHHRLDTREGPVQFVKVKAHLHDETVHPLNVRADELAGRAARAAQESGAEVSERGWWQAGIGPVPGDRPDGRRLSNAGLGPDAMPGHPDPAAAAVSVGADPARAQMDPHRDGMLF